MGRESFGVALAHGGTLSGEHGVGGLKRPYFEQALGPVSVEVQKRIKQALDPLNILNPGKMFQE
jgi:glycolate oxidase